MYKLMIVDDDELIRERLRNMLPLEKLDLELCAEAADGEAALELFHQHSPQIVIADINIPLINGLDFSKRILEENKNTSVIIITGYGTLDFAREAIHLGTTNFLLKPIDYDEMETTLCGIIRRLDDERERYRRQCITEQLLHESLPLLRERYLGGLLFGTAQEQDETKCREHLDRLQISLKGRIYCCAVVIPIVCGINQSEREALQLALENVLGEACAAAGIYCTVFFDMLSRCIVLAGSDEEHLSTKLEYCVNAAREKLRYYFQADFSAGIGQEIREVRTLQESCRGAERALSYKSVFSENNIVNIKNVICSEAPRAATMRAEREEITALLLNAQSDGMSDAIQRYFSKVIASSNGSETYVRQLCIELLASVLSCAREAGLDTEDVSRTDPYGEILLASKPFRAQKLLETLCVDLIGQLRQKRENRACRMIEQAKKYIGEHYPDPNLSLSAVSEHVGLSAVYFSCLFKKEIGSNFTDYINRVRIEHAKTLLAATNMRVYEVSDAVGYLSTKYFFQVFKRLTGKRPREFSSEGLPSK